MARIRTIKPEMWESEKLGKLPVIARLTFVGLISMADDAGRGRGSAPYLRGRIHAYSPDVTDKDCAEAMLALERARLAQFYEVDGCSYYALPNWSEHQYIEKPKKSAIPKPTGESLLPLLQPMADESPKVPLGVGDEEGMKRGLITLGREGKGREQGKEQGKERAGDGFDGWFWPMYPNKAAKKDARKAWDKLAPDEALQAKIRAGLEAHKRSRKWTKDNGDYIPLPATFLRGRRWEDEVAGPLTPTQDDSAPYVADTPVKKIICSYKIAMGIAWDDRAWDRNLVNDALLRDATGLLEAFSGNGKEAEDFLHNYAAEMKAANFNWTLSSARKRAWNGRGERESAERSREPARPRALGEVRIDKKRDGFTRAGEIDAGFMPPQDEFKA